MTKDEAINETMQKAFFMDAENRTNKDYITAIFDAGVAYAEGQAAEQVRAERERIHRILVALWDEHHGLGLGRAELLQLIEDVRGEE